MTTTNTDLSGLTDCTRIIGESWNDYQIVDVWYVEGRANYDVFEAALVNADGERRTVRCRWNPDNGAWFDPR